ncbi:MAG: DUF1501 domain-containing protein [Planctomycetia bacterium]|nr:DUF1501 domain-containing protein [Planctomycetia bacterium]
MLTLWGKQRSFCDTLSRRDFLRVGALGFGGLTLPDLYRLRAQEPARAEREQKAIIMIGLPGGPSQFEMYDLKPDAPEGIRGEFKPIQTNVPGMAISELFPLQAQIADQLAIVRGVNFYFDDAHSQQLIYTGYGRPDNVGAPIPGRMRRPAFGSVFSRLRGSSTAEGMPSYVSMIRSTAEGNGDGENPAYAGAAHRAFCYDGPILKNLQPTKDVSLERLADRKELLRGFDTLQRDIDVRGQIAGMDAHAARAFDLLTSPKVRQAFDVSKEPESVRAKYGKIANKGEAGSVDPDKLLMARRLVEAGVSVVTLQVGGWDDHGSAKEGGIFNNLRKRLPVLDRALYGLLTDLKERGLDKHVTVLMWGEMGRTPKINNAPGRDHWADSGFAFFAGGAGMPMGQVIGETDARGERAKGKRYTVQNVLATVYNVLGIDPASTIPDHTGRPQYLLDEREPITELV